MSRRWYLLYPPAIAARTLVFGFLSSRRGRSRRVRLPRHRLLSKRDAQHLIDPLHRTDIQVSLDVVRDLHQVLLVLARNEHGLDATAVRRQQLLLEAADRQDFPAQGDLARHGDI